MCEAAAQVCSYVSQRYDLLGAEMVGFGGMEDVRFRGPSLDVTVAAGSVLGANLVSGTATIADLTLRRPLLQVQGLL